MIHLVNMPFADIVSPSLALGLIKAELQAAGMPARAFNLNLTLSEAMGFKPYRRLALSNIPLSEWLFAPYAWDEAPALSSPEEMVAQYGFRPEDTPQWRAQVEQLLRWRDELIPQFLEDSFGQLANAGPLQTIAFSCTFFQTLPALAFGRFIKARVPDARVVFGGASFHDEVGYELIKKCDWMDAVCTGEGDDIIVPLFRALANAEVPDGLRGVAYRRADGHVVTGLPAGPAPDQAFAEAAEPDFEEFFAQADSMGLTADPGWQREAVVPFEASRGCWWGEKAHCTFCGLNGTGMSYRVKPEANVRRTMASYLARYPAKRLHAADNLIAMQAFKDFLPALKETPINGASEIFFHVKSNFNRRQLEALADAGVTDVGPGIESLNSHLLQLMRKGVSALQNVYFLKICRELGLKPRWTNLIRVPGEQREDYAQMEAWIPQVLHLSPPSGAGEIQLHRFSPYFFERDRWVHNLRPHGAYRALYPEPIVALEKVAYVFDGDWQDCLPDDARAEVKALTDGWRQRWHAQNGPPRLEVVARAPTSHAAIQIVDTRTHALREHSVYGIDATVLDHLADPMTRRRLDAAIPADSSEISEAITRLKQAALVLEEGGKWLSLVVDSSRRTPSTESQTMALDAGVVVRAPAQGPVGHRTE